MTEWKAIMMAKAMLKCVENRTSGIGELCSRECYDCDLSYAQGNMGEQQEWLKESISAMEKQIPKEFKVITKKDAQGTIKYVGCPTCEGESLYPAYIRKRYDYCPYCGQKLIWNWGGEDE